MEKFLKPEDIRQSSRDIPQANYARSVHLKEKRSGHARKNPADEWLEVNKKMMGNPKHPYIEFMVHNPNCGPGVVMGNESSYNEIRSQCSTQYENPSVLCFDVTVSSQVFTLIFFCRIKYIF